MALPDYNYLYDHACERKGGEKALKALLPKTKSKAHLKKLGSDRYLAEFTRKIFQSGFVWRVVDKKWPQFEGGVLGVRRGAPPDDARRHVGA